MKDAIQVCELKKSYGSHMVLKGLDFQIEKGEIFEEKRQRLNVSKV